MTPARSTSGVILAGGRSRRLGRDKARLLLSGATLLDRTISVLQPLVDELLVIGAGAEAPSAVRLIADDVAGLGPLGGLATALHHMTGEHALVVACDLPFLNRDLLRYLLVLAPGYDAVVPRVHGRGQPLHAVYARSIGPQVARQIATGEYRMEELLARLGVRWVEDAEIGPLDSSYQSFFNVNTPADWKLALALET